MGKQVIVFDFDKTLTYKDTLLSFFIFASQGSILQPIKVMFYFILMVLAKFKIISNKKLKSLGITIFLKNMSSKKVNDLSFHFKKVLKFNNLFKNFNFKDENTDIYIISASFKAYLIPIFPKNVKVIGSEILYEHGIVKGLKFNCFKENKIKALAKYGISKIDLFYTDSFSDYPLATLSKKIIIVENDLLIECSSIQEFNNFFGK